MKNTIMRGFFVLSVSGLLCKIIGAFFRLPLTYILGVDGIGVFQLVMSVFSFVLVLSSGGISVTLSKLISSARAKRDFGKIKWQIYLAVTYCVIVSFFIGLIFLAFAKSLAIFQQASSAKLSYMFFLPLLIFASFVALLRGVYQGYENMIPTAISQIIEQVGKFVLGLLFAFVFAKHSLQGGVFGAFLGILIGEVFAFIYLVFSFNTIKLGKTKIKDFTRKEFYSYLLPATLGLSISSFIHFFDSLVVVNRLSKAGFSSSQATSLYGLQTGVVGALLNFPMIISTSLITTLLPKLSYEYTQKGESDKGLQNNFSCLWFVLLPITFGMVSVSKALYKFIYPFFDDLMIEYAVKLTALGAVSTILFSVMQFLISILQARGLFKRATIFQGVAGLFKIILTMFLCSIKAINIYGIVIGNIVYSIVVVCLCLIQLKGIKLTSLDVFFVPLLSSLVMLVAISLFSMTISVSLLLNLFLSVVFGIVIYFILTIPILKRFKKQLIGKKSDKG